MSLEVAANTAKALSAEMRIGKGILVEVADSLAGSDEADRSAHTLAGGRRGATCSGSRE